MGSWPSWRVEQASCLPIDPSEHFSIVNQPLQYQMTVASDSCRGYSKGFLKCPVFIVWVKLYKVLNTEERGLCIHSNNRSHSSVLSKFSLISLSVASIHTIFSMVYISFRTLHWSPWGILLCVLLSIYARFLWNFFFVCFFFLYEPLYCFN